MGPAVLHDALESMKWARSERRERIPKERREGKGREGRKERDIKVKITLELICRVILTDVWRIGYCRIIKIYTTNAERIKLGMVVTPDLEVTTELVSMWVNKHLHDVAFPYVHGIMLPSTNTVSL